MHPHADALTANLPKDLSADARTLLLAGGGLLAIADAGVLTLHEMPDGRTHRRIPVHGRIGGLAACPLGLVVAVQGTGGDWELLLVAEQREHSSRTSTSAGMARRSSSSRRGSRARASARACPMAEAC